MTQINEHIFGYTIALTETIPLNVYLVKGGRQSVFIDSGINSMHEGLMQVLADTKSELRAILHTHSHHDHIGGSARLVETTGCKVIAPERYAHWHSNWKAHLDEFARPFPQIFTDTPELREEVFGILDAPHEVNDFCHAGDRWQLEDGVELECFTFSGHMLEEVGWLEHKTGTLLLGDVITLLDAPFIHGHLTVEGYRSSLQELKSMADKGLFKQVLMAHFPPLDLPKFNKLIQLAHSYLDHLEETMIQVLKEGANTLETIWLASIKALGKQREFRSLSTINAHLKDLAEKGIIRKLPDDQYVYAGE